MTDKPDIVVMQEWWKDSAAFGLLCSYISTSDHRLSDRANDALEWAVENSKGTIDIGDVSYDGFVYLIFWSKDDAAMFKTFWL